ncbi:hypothetical protein N8I74_11100 [Chitiniphilus purpureus]|uniref:Uncharacterized protein n=1 Tax=Chitiniphilus purpureus TaxID=2981137 RepID=A0ABY6DHP8_9NEIS|nr:hypothetical protein [Chitiniphilus sp. CD1]UXY13869.1 hypothetical protein N8I74_11100 [Chitiniphilus sp. CD1]
MTRVIDPGTAAMLQAPVQRMLHLYELYLDGYTVTLTDDIEAVDWAGTTYAASGHALNFELDGETSDLAIHGCRVQLSGVEPSIMAVARQYDFLGRRLVLYRAYRDAAGELTEPLQLFDGRCDGPLIEEDPDAGSSVITISASNRFVDFERVRGRMTNHEDAQAHFPGDRGFEYVPFLDRELQWGGL